MMIKILNKLYPGKENYKKRNAIYRKVRSVIGGIKFIGKCAIFSPIIIGISIAVIG